MSFMTKKKKKKDAYGKCMFTGDFKRHYVDKIGESTAHPQ